MQGPRRADFHAATPDPGFTLPTTYFRTSHLIGPGELGTLDDHHLEPEHAHWPLIAMLVLTQLSVGGFAAELVAVAFGSSGGAGALLQEILCLGLGWAGLGASVLHLGRPLFAYRALIGVRHSWLSREVLAFALFTTMATVYVALAVVAPGPFAAAWGVRAALLALVVATGFAGVTCSVLVYHVVRRPFWRAHISGVKFLGTAVVLGPATALAALGIASLRQPDMLTWPGSSSPLVAVAVCLIVASSAKLWFEARLVRGFGTSELAALRQTALLLVGSLQRPAGLRRLLGVVGGVVLPALAAMAAATANPGATAAAAIAALLISVAGEISERYLFFTAVVRPKMPGGLTT